MAFSSLAANQMVSEADAATSGFVLKPGQSHGSSNQCMDKNAATTKYNLNTSYLTSYVSNQLIPKNVWVAGGDITPPSYASAEIHLINKTDSSITCGWSGWTDNVGIDHYVVFVRLYSTNAIVHMSADLSAATSSYTATGLMANTAHYYELRAFDLAGNNDAISLFVTTNAASDTTPPTAPTTVSANLSGGTVLVTWGGATDNVGIDSYEVWHSTDAVTYSLLDSVFSEAYIDDFYSSGWNYYKIKTVDTSGNKSPFSSVASIFM